MLNTILADFLVAVHLGYVAFAVSGQLLIFLGLALRWHWVRNLRFRVIHLVMVEVVALEGVFNIRCPLTDLEDELRKSTQRTVAAAIMELPYEPPADMTGAEDDAAGPEFAFVFQQDNPVVAEFPPAPNVVKPPEQPAEDTNETFVGWLLGSILYVSVPQATLDKWYVVFGVITLIVFVVFPPRHGAWTEVGFAGMILFWIGGVFLCTLWYDQLLSPSITDHKPPTAMGAALIVLGGVCALAARRTAKAPPTA